MKIYKFLLTLYLMMFTLILGGAIQISYGIVLKQLTDCQITVLSIPVFVLAAAIVFLDERAAPERGDSDVR